MIRALGVLFISVFLLSPCPALTAAAAPEGGSAAEMGPAPPAILGLTLVQGGSTLAVFRVTGEKLPVPDVLSTDENGLVLLWEGVILPSGYWERSFPTPLVQGVVLRQEPEGVQMQIRSTRRVYLGKTVGDPPSPMMHLHLTTGEIAEEITLPVTGVPKVVAGDPFASSAPVNLQLRDSDLRDVFRMLGSMVNMNVVIDPSVPATPVTISLNNVPMNEAFQYLMRMYDVSYAIMGKTIIIGKKDNLSRTMGMEKTRAFRVAYADLGQVPALLQGLSGVASVVVDERLRTVYVTASEERLEDVAVTLQRIDHPGRQVMLQARIVEVSESGSDELKSLVNAVYDRWYASFSSTGGVIGYFDDGNVISPYENNPAYDPARDAREINPPESITFPELSGNTLRFFDASLQILEREDKAKMLASPSVVTLDGQKASIKLLTDIKYVSERDDQGRPTYGEVESGPSLEFTPIVGRSDIVTIEMNVKTGDAILTYDSLLRGYIPQSTTREVQTVVRVRDGEPFVVGGLFNESKSENEWKVPIISDIPLLGELFKGRNTTLNKSEVIMVVVPYILDVPESAIQGSDVRLN
ncbi:MAG: Type II and III secretion system protein [Synergistales bacterium 58_81]|nr:MAG: Type II and III secretion system protein [Synergistales bacterium 58_81]